MTFPLSITKDEVMERPLGRYEGKISVVTKKADIDRVLDELSNEPAVGFDTEAKPTFKKGQKRNISLVQIATPKRVFLLRIKESGITNKMKDFFENELVAKVGIGLVDDFQLLNAIRSFEPTGFVDLNDTFTELGAEKIGARNLAAMVLNIRISKSAQTSNWEADTLTEKQLRYAATDAWICLEMYSKLLNWGYI
jgi:ribonuclease D